MEDVVTKIRYSELGQLTLQFEYLGAASSQTNQLYQKIELRGRIYESIKVKHNKPLVAKVWHRSILIRT